MTVVPNRFEKALQADGNAGWYKYYNPPSITRIWMEMKETDNPHVHYTVDGEEKIMPVETREEIEMLVWMAANETKPIRCK